MPKIARGPAPLRPGAATPSLISADSPKTSSRPIGRSALDHRRVHHRVALLEHAGEFLVGDVFWRLAVGRAELLDDDVPDRVDSDVDVLVGEVEEEWVELDELVAETVELDVDVAEGGTAPTDIDGV